MGREYFISDLKKICIFLNTMNDEFFVYNMGFEKGVLRKLANMFADFFDGLLAIHDNVDDLMIPFQKKDYYTPPMNGSYSIKYVLPA